MDVTMARGRCNSLSILLVFFWWRLWFKSSFCFLFFIILVILILLLNVLLHLFSFSIMYAYNKIGTAVLALQDHQPWIIDVAYQYDHLRRRKNKRISTHSTQVIIYMILSLHHIIITIVWIYGKSKPSRRRTICWYQQSTNVFIKIRQRTIALSW